MENIRNFSYDEIETHFLKIGEKISCKTSLGMAMAKTCHQL
jgi:hypothetical protein